MKPVDGNYPRHQALHPDYLRETFRLDATTGRLYWLKPPRNHARLLGKEAGTRAPNSNGKVYVVVCLWKLSYRRSHLVYCMATGKWPTRQIDHRNGFSLDDRPENLRLATATENSRNVRRKPKRDGLPMGVRRSRGRFCARIRVDGELMHLGVFDTVGEAETVYLAARAKHFGEFA